MQPGVHDGLTHEAYHASPGISKSGLARYAGNPARYRFGGPVLTRPMKLGRLVHSVLLEPEETDTRFLISRLAVHNENHKAYQAEVTKAAGREIIKTADYEVALRIRDAIMRSSIGREYVTPGLIVERSIAWHDPATSALCRARPDAIDPERRIILDFKSCHDASHAAFADDALRYRYHWQDTWYSDGMRIADGWEPEAFVFIPVEKEPPYLVAGWIMNPPARALARSETAAVLKRYARSLFLDNFPGHSDQVETMSLPARAFAPVQQPAATAELGTPTPKRAGPAQIASAISLGTAANPPTPAIIALTKEQTAEFRKEWDAAQGGINPRGSTPLVGYVHPHYLAAAQVPEQRPIDPPEPLPAKPDGLAETAARFAAASATGPDQAAPPRIRRSKRPAPGFDAEFGNVS